MNQNILDIPIKPEEKNYIIAYIDILGIKNLLSNEDTEDIFDKIYHIFLIAKNLIPKLSIFDSEEVKIKVFSDNILIAFPVDNSEDKNNVFEAYRKLGGFLKFFLYMFAKDGILFRGAISLNKLLINDVMVWGTGLSEVVFLEENVAIYPRIVISEKLLCVFNKFNLSGVEYEEKFSCLKDTDGCVFFDFFDYQDFQAMEVLLKSAKMHIDKKINKENNPKILQKLFWFKNYLCIAKEIYNEIKIEADL